MHQKEETRLHRVREANSLARDCTMDLPQGTRVALASHYFASIAGQRLFFEAKEPLACVPDYHAFAYDLVASSLDICHHHIQVPMDHIEPTFWDEHNPFTAAHKIV